MTDYFEMVSGVVREETERLLEESRQEREDHRERAYSEAFSCLNYLYGNNTFPTETKEQFAASVEVLDECFRVKKLLKIGDL